MTAASRRVGIVRPSPHIARRGADDPTEANMKPERDIEKTYPVADFVEKLRRLADSLEKGERFDIQIAGERIFVPARATYNIEHERGEDGEEIEFQIKWTNG
jgi:amphi-Trp domain-containing protein